MGYAAGSTGVFPLPYYLLLTIPAYRWDGSDAGGGRSGDVAGVPRWGGGERVSV